MVRALFFLVTAIIFVVILTPLSWFKGSFTRKAYGLFYKIVCAGLGLKIHVTGDVLRDKRPKIFVCNHSSFIDILVLGAVLPASFISKAEVAKWPLIGYLAKVTGTVFINRKRSGVEKQMEEMTEKLLQGTNLILFPEGTTTNGRKIHDFKTSFFRLASREEFKGDFVVQPVTLSYTHASDMPNRFYEKKNYYWIGDMDLMPSLKYFFSPTNTTVNIHANKPLEGEEINQIDYKELANLSKDRVQNGLDNINANIGVTNVPATSNS